MRAASADGDERRPTALTGGCATGEENWALGGHRVGSTAADSRHGESIRDWMHARFAEQLDASSTPVVRPRGPFDDRIAQASAAIDALLAKPFDL
jgi:HTH-type transcriptional repressor of NAD biosynthesis genes